MQVESSKAIARKSRNKQMDLDTKEAPISEVERIKLDTKTKIPESRFLSIWSEVTETNVGKWDYEEFKARMEATDPSILVRRMLDSGLAHVVGFPSIVQCYELFLECARNYDQGI